jgi:hypothetical protein
MYDSLHLESAIQLELQILRKLLCVSLPSQGALVGYAFGLPLASERKQQHLLESRPVMPLHRRVYFRWQDLFPTFRMNL